MKNNKKKFFTPEYLYEADKIWIYKDKILHGPKILKKLYLLLAFRIMKKCHCLIPMNENINKFITPHGLIGIYISFGASIGKNCVIFNGVTIGSNTLKDSKGYGAPKIGNNVYIGAGARIIGNVTIEDNCRIGANCIVTTDILENSTVVMPHPRIIKKEKQNNNSYCTWKESETNE